MKVGIVSYGAFIPRLRIRSQEIARVWGKDGEAMSRGLNIIGKSVPNVDEDVITISVEAARNAMRRCGISGDDIGAIFTGSESHPYAVKPTSTIVAEAIGAAPHLTAADFEFACKAGTAAIQACMGMVGAGLIKYGMAIGADTSQGAPGDALEYSASAGGAAYLIGKDGKDSSDSAEGCSECGGSADVGSEDNDEGMKEVIASIEHTYSFTTDTPDFWRREGEKYPRHGGRFTGLPAYFRHVSTCARQTMEIAGTEPGDYDHAVFHQPNGKFPVRVAKSLGFTTDQVKTGLLTPRIGNTYSGAVPVGLSAILDEAKTGNRVLVVAYGSGAGSDGFDIEITDAIESYPRNAAPSTLSMVEDEKFIDYALYAKLRSKIEMRGGE